MAMCILRAVHVFVARCPLPSVFLLLLLLSSRPLLVPGELDEVKIGTCLYVLCGGGGSVCVSVCVGRRGGSVCVSVCGGEGGGGGC